MSIGTVRSEFAAVRVGIDSAGNGPRLRIEDLRTGRVGYLDPLELETLAWLPDGALHPLLDPSALRFADGPRERSVTELVRSVYAALAAGDRERLLALLAEDFEADLPAGMPIVETPIRSAREMIERAWWPLGRACRVRVEPLEWIPCVGGRLLVLGRYRGRGRATGREFEAKFVHLWSARDGRVTHLWHLTDTAAWVAAIS